MTSGPAVFAVLLVAAAWLMVVGLMAAWWTGDAVGWPTVWEAAGAVALAFWALQD